MSTGQYLAIHLLLLQQQINSGGTFRLILTHVISDFTTLAILEIQKNKFYMIKLFI